MVSIPTVHLHRRPGPERHIPGPSGEIREGGRRPRKFQRKLDEVAPRAEIKDELDELHLSAAEETRQGPTPALHPEGYINATGFHTDDKVATRQWLLQGSSEREEDDGWGWGSLREEIAWGIIFVFLLPFSIPLPFIFNCGKR